MRRQAVWVGAGMLAATLAFGGLAWRWYASPARRLEPLGQVSEFSLPAATSRGPATLARADLAGRWWLADFVFTYCGGPCPLMTARMSELQRSLSPDVRFVSFTVDPDRDDLEVLARYAARFGADPLRWHFVRAEKPELSRLVYEDFKLPVIEDPEAPSGYRVTHTTKFVLVDGQGRIRAYFDYGDEDLAERISGVIARVQARG